MKVPGDDRRQKSSSHAVNQRGFRGATAEKVQGPEKYKTALRSYRFQRARTPGIIEVLNENSYVMAEYSERTKAVKWQRLVLASQREQIEKWLADHY